MTILGGSNITTDSDCSHEIKRRLLLGRKVMTQPRQHIKKQRHYFVKKVRLVKVMVFPVIMYGCESWTIKKPEHQRIDAFELWCPRRFLRVPWTARRSNQSIHKGDPSWVFIGRTDVEAETPILGPPDADSLEKTLMLGEIEGRRKGRQRMRLCHHRLNGHEFGCTPGSWWWTGRPGMLQFMGSQRVRHDWATELNWTLRKGQKCLSVYFAH